MKKPPHALTVYRTPRSYHICLRCSSSTNPSVSASHRYFTSLIHKEQAKGPGATWAVSDVDPSSNGVCHPCAYKFYIALTAMSDPAQAVAMRPIFLVCLRDYPTSSTTVWCLPEVSAYVCGFLLALVRTVSFTHSLVHSLPPPLRTESLRCQRTLQRTFRLNINASVQTAASLNSLLRH